MKSSADIRKLYLEFFQDKGHTIVPSSSLVPADDPTLLFTNAGMVQFKKLFLGQETRHYKRAVTSQRCIRAGGKHNDLENVGYTARHHTFFEMLGNFSFGDYFKRDAIYYAWQFLTEVLAIAPEKLWITVFIDDDDSKKIWLNDIGVDAARLSEIDSKDNFWSMGDTGPCGPCSEIFYDHGDHIPGGPPGSSEAEGDRYIEIWNLVFMQYNREQDGSMTPLPQPSVDTGMGLERLVAVLQNVHSNYQIDLFKRLISHIQQLSATDDTHHTSLQVIADHIRSSAFMITDGIQPSNEGRGYVLRRIIRRAVRHGYKLGLKKAFFHTLVAPLVAEMGAAFPELFKAQTQVEKIIKQEELRFADTLDKGLKLLEKAISHAPDKTISGDTLFLLYDTYGFPVDLTADIARERQLTLDITGFEKNMQAQRERARKTNQFNIDGLTTNGWQSSVMPQTQFCGYDHTTQTSRIINIIVDNNSVQQLKQGQTGMIILDSTPFYAEGGGQVGDGGDITSESAHFTVTATHKENGVIAHIGSSQRGELKKGDNITAHINEARRLAIARNHSATHLLHAALRQILGETCVQKGSLVEANRLRFDFAHPHAVSKQKLITIEKLVNHHIRLNHPIETTTMNLEKAKQSGAVALFGEKYDEKVRVLRMGEFSIELCGGTHAHRTGDIGLLKIISETGIASGVRRIEALTGEAALDDIHRNEGYLGDIANLVKAKPDKAAEKTEQLILKMRGLEKELATIKGKLTNSHSHDLINAAKQIGNVHVLAAELDGADSKSMRDTVDKLKDKLGTAVIILAATHHDKIILIGGVTHDTTDKIRAGDLVAYVAKQVGGKGGGRADMAQGGGNQPKKLKAALHSVFDWAQSALEQ